MNKRLLALLPGALAIALVAPGCGGGDDGSSDSEASTTASSLTKAEYVKEGRAICAETLKDMKEVFRDIEEMERAEGPQGSSQLEVGLEFIKNDMLPALEAQLEELRELPAPKAEEGKLDAIYRAMEKGITLVREESAQDRFQLGNTSMLKAKEMAEKYGLSGCVAIV